MILESGILINHNFDCITLHHCCRTLQMLMQFSNMYRPRCGSGLCSVSMLTYCIYNLYRDSRHRGRSQVSGSYSTQQQSLRLTTVGAQYAQGQFGNKDVWQNIKIYPCRLTIDWWKDKQCMPAAEFLFFQSVDIFCINISTNKSYNSMRCCWCCCITNQSWCLCNSFPWRNLIRLLFWVAECRIVSLEVLTKKYFFIWLELHFHFERFVRNPLLNGI